MVELVRRQAVGEAGVIYGSVCSGIEAATAAWHPLGWRPAFFAEIDPFPRAVLAHHYPDVPLHGDFTTIQQGDYAAIDLLVGGTPCQSFSVAGLRGGMADERGNLALEYLRLADRLRPRWLVWENVPGVLSSSAGRDFGSFVGGLAELGYGWAYRVLDAQYVRTRRFPGAVPQRRRRVFVVGHLGDWRRAAAVLLERESLSGHPAPRRESRQGTAARAVRGAALGVDLHDAADTGEMSCTLDTGMARGNRGLGVIAPDVARCVLTGEGSSQDYESTTMVAHALRGEGFDASEDGTGRGTPLVPIAFHPTQEPISSVGVVHALGTGSSGGCASAAVAFDAAPTLTSANNPSRSPQSAEVTMQVAAVHRASMQVRRLTPRECERLMGFGDYYTLVPYRGKPAADGPRYKALGNSMAVNVMDWIGQRIATVEELGDE
jgi:DNA (cytosine-5)-methyltransferase 1